MTQQLISSKQYLYFEWVRNICDRRVPSTEPEEWPLRDHFPGRCMKLRQAGLLPLEAPRDFQTHLSSQKRGWWLLRVLSRQVELAVALHKPGFQRTRCGVNSGKCVLRTITVQCPEARASWITAPAPIPHAGLGLENGTWVLLCSPASLINPLPVPVGMKWLTCVGGQH